MKSSALGLIFAALFWTSGAAFAAPTLTIEMPDWKTTPVEDRDLGHGVHMLESFGGNIGVIAGENGVLLVDAEYPELNSKVLAAVARISKQPVRQVINTHWHWDHMGANSMFARAGATLYSSPETRKYIIEAQKAKIDTYVPDPTAVPAITIGSTLTFHVGGQTVEVMHVAPAHTGGDLVVRYVEADVIQTGDTFFHGFYPDIDYEHGGTIDGMIAWYDKLYAMCGPKTKIIPGHGAVANREDVREYQAMLREVRTIVARAIAAGQSEEALIASHPLDELDKKWGGNLVKAPYLLGIVYEDLKMHGVH